MIKTADTGRRLNLKVGQWVEVRSAEEILATLDSGGRLDNMPFMTEMLPFCGQKFQVFRRADKTCQPVHGWTMRRLRNCVILTGLRCNGRGHDGCEAACSIFWKEAWLKPTTPTVPGETSHSALVSITAKEPAGLDRLITASRRTNEHGEFVYSCQATELLAFTSPLRWWDPRPYIRDLTSGNLETGYGSDTKAHQTLDLLVRILRLLQAAIIYVSWERFGITYPFFSGRRQKTPLDILNLQPGEVVQVRSKNEIMATLDTENRNRGMWFDREMLPYCGGIYRVQGRVRRMIDEKTGKMLVLKNPCVILEEVVCRGDFHALCPKQVYVYWRESWLRRISFPDDTINGAPRPIAVPGQTRNISETI